MEQPEAPPTIVDVLTEDGLDALFSQLGIEELLHCAGTCRAWRSTALQAHRWEQAAQRQLGRAVLQSDPIARALDALRGESSAASLARLAELTPFVATWGEDRGPDEWGTPTPPPPAFGILGRGDAPPYDEPPEVPEDRLVPHVLAPLGTAVPISRIAVGGYHCFALAAAAAGSGGGGGGGAYAWGANTFGQLGLGDRISRARPEPVRLPVDPTEVTCGYAFTLLRLAGGRHVACGFNRNGRCGVPDGAEGVTLSEDGDALLLTPVRCAAADEVARISGLEIVEMSAGSGHSAVKTADGAVWVWGRNDRGQLGARARASEAGGEFTARVESGCDSWRPLRLSDLPAEAKQIACGAYHTLALLRSALEVIDPTGGTVWSWGDCGSPGGRARAPHRVPYLGAATSIAAGSFISAAVCDGQLYTWGCGRAAEMAVPKLATLSPADVDAFVAFLKRGPDRPLRVLIEGRRISTVALGGTHAVAISVDGVALVWTLPKRAQRDGPPLHPPPPTAWPYAVR